MNVDPLIARLRQKAEDLRRITPDGANALEWAARTVEQYARESHAEELTIRQAAMESGYSQDQLRRHLAQGRIPNAGRPGRPRIRRGDLPRKPGPPRSRQPVEGPDLAGTVLEAQGLAIGTEDDKAKP